MTHPRSETVHASVSSEPKGGKAAMGDVLSPSFLRPSHLSDLIPELIPTSESRCVARLECLQPTGQARLHWRGPVLALHLRSVFPDVYLFTRAVYVLDQEARSARWHAPLRRVVWNGPGASDLQSYLVWRVGDKWFVAGIIVASGETPSAAMRKLRKKIKRTAGDVPGGHRKRTREQDFRGGSEPVA